MRDAEYTSSFDELARFAGVHRTTVHECKKLPGFPIRQDGTVCKWELCEWFVRRSIIPETVIEKIYISNCWCGKEAKKDGLCLQCFKQKEELEATRILSKRGPEPKPKKPCPACGRPIISNGLCGTHSDKFLRLGRPEMTDFLRMELENPSIVEVKNEGKKCLECDNPATTKLRCRNCYCRQMRKIKNNGGSTPW